MTRHSLSTRFAAAAFAVLTFAAVPAMAAAAPNDEPPQPAKPKGPDGKAIDAQQFRDAYLKAHGLIQSGRYAEGIAALHALKHDEHPDVANYIGYANRKLGDYTAAKVWYEKALAADPKHVRTWQYYGMWHVEQGNMLKAQDHLQTIKLICGEDCKEYRDLKGGMEGTVVY